MTPTEQSTFDTELDEIAYGLYEEGGIDRELNGYNKERVVSAKQAIKALILSEVIGEDIPTVGPQNEANEVSLEDYENAAINCKLAEQRAIVEGKN